MNNASSSKKLVIINDIEVIKYCNQEQQQLIMVKKHDTELHETLNPVKNFLRTTLPS